MHLVRMNFSGVPPLTEPVAFRFDERVNVFIGPNASGKSVLLRLLAEHLTGTAPHRMGYPWLSLLPDEEFDEFVEDPGVHQPPNFLSASPDWLDREMQHNEPNPPAIYIGAVREGLPGVSEQASPDAFGDTAAEVLAGPFSGSRTMAACHLLGDELWDLEPDDPQYYAALTLTDAIKLADTCSRRICDEVIQDSESHNYIPGPDMRGFLAHPRPNLNRITILRSMGLKTKDRPKFDHLSGTEQPDNAAYWGNSDDLPIYLGHASAGTEGTLLWIRWLALKMVHHYDFTEDWAQQPAILLIDEIENHLHPTWQRRVIPALQEHFPKLQIFATTHSPFVIAGLKRGQLHLLNRDGNGIVTASTNERDVIGWTADEILRTMMGVDEPTDQLTVIRAARLRQLRGKEKLTTKEEAELNELRRQVNADLLAKGGPLEARRERYADLIRSFLLSRQSDLTQEGE